MKDQLAAHAKACEAGRADLEKQRVTAINKADSIGVAMDKELAGVGTRDLIQEHKEDE